MPSSSLRTSLLWNLISFGFVGISGLLLILGIARFYPPEALGVFNLVYSLYIIGSQLAGSGIHFSVLRHVPELRDDRGKAAAALCSALLCSFVSSLIWSALFIAAAPFLVSAFAAPPLGAGLLAVAPALFLCGQNKVLLAFLNAQERFAAYAVLYSFRAIVLLAALGICIALGASGSLLPLVLSISEAALYASLVFLLRRELLEGRKKELRQWCSVHLPFGGKSVLGSMLIDANTRIDILILGLFQTEHVVGIYSYVAMLVDGFNQLPIVVRTVLNPRITQEFSARGVEGLQSFVSRWRNRSYIGLASAGLLILLLYAPVISFLSLDPVFLEGFWPLVILLGFNILTVGYAPFLMLFNQTGHPGAQSLLYLAVFVANAAGNFLLVPGLGMMGSALGTAVSYLIFVVTLKYLARKRLGASI